MRHVTIRLGPEIRLNADMIANLLVQFEILEILEESSTGARNPIALERVIVSPGEQGNFTRVITSLLTGKTGP